MSLSTGWWWVGGRRRSACRNNGRLWGPRTGSEAAHVTSAYPCCKSHLDENYCNVWGTLWSSWIGSFIHTCTHASIHLSIHTVYIHTHTHTYILYTYMYVLIHVCTYIRVYTQREPQITRYCSSFKHKPPRGIDPCIDVAYIYRAILSVLLEPTYYSMLYYTILWVGLLYALQGRIGLEGSVQTLISLHLVNLGLSASWNTLAVRVSMCEHWLRQPSVWSPPSKFRMISQVCIGHIEPWLSALDKHTNRDHDFSIQSICCACRSDLQEACGYESAAK